MKLLLLLALSIPASVLAAQLTPEAHMVIYGTDNRVEVYQASPRMRIVAQSTASLMERGDLLEASPGVFKTRPTSTLGVSGNLCSGERFADQPVVAGCSGFLVGPDLLVTAGHCIDDVEQCTSHLWVFGFHVDPVTKLAGQAIKQEDIYSCKQVIAHELNDETGADYALVQLQRVVKDRAPLKFRQEGKISDKAFLTLIGNPSMIPTKVAGGARVNGNDNELFFEATTDSFHGNSGSAVINEDTFEVEGILVRGEEDYNLDTERGCSVVNVCPEEGCSPKEDEVGEDATRITHILELGMQQKILKAARSGDLNVITTYLGKSGWVDMYDNKRESMLFKAVRGDQYDVLAMLMQNDADVDLQDIYGNTALHLAVKLKNREMVEALLDAGADPKITNKTGKTAADLCKWHSLKQRKIRKVLSRRTNNG